MARAEKQKQLCNTNNIGPNLGPKCTFFKAAVRTVNDYGNPPEIHHGYPCLVGQKTKLCLWTINDGADKKIVFRRDPGYSIIDGPQGTYVTMVTNIISIYHPSAHVHLGHLFTFGTPYCLQCSGALASSHFLVSLTSSKFHNF